MPCAFNPQTGAVIVTGADALQFVPVDWRGKSSPLSTPPRGMFSFVETDSRRLTVRWPDECFAALISLSTGDSPCHVTARAVQFTFPGGASFWCAVAVTAGRSENDLTAAVDDVVEHYRGTADGYERGWLQ